MQGTDSQPTWIAMQRVLLMGGVPEHHRPPCVQPVTTVRGRDEGADGLVDLRDAVERELRWGRLALRDGAFLWPCISPFQTADCGPHLIVLHLGRSVRRVMNGAPEVGAGRKGFLNRIHRLDQPKPKTVELLVRQRIRRSAADLNVPAGPPHQVVGARIELDEVRRIAPRALQLADEGLEVVR
jgi:hypothetical protein